VIDADGHCNEPWEDLTPWMPKEYHHRAPVGFADRHGTSRMYVEGRLSTRTEGLGPGVSGPFAPHIKGGRPGERDARQRLPDMDQEGVDVAIIFGTRVALSVNGLRDKELAGVLCRAVNRWLLEEYLPIDPKRLKGVGLIPCQDPLAAVKELEWLIQHRQDGVVSAMLPVNVYGINLGDRRFDPIYELAEAAGLPLAVHPQTGHDGQYGVWGTMGAGSERMEKYSYVHMTAFAFEPMIALMHMI
jgi:predicted TIM-barrel fold metal-dependent hydrolase